SSRSANKLAASARFLKIIEIRALRSLRPRCCRNNCMSNTYAPCPRCEAINRVPINRAEAEAPVCGRCKTALPVEHGIVEVSGTSLQHLIDHMQLPTLTDF